MKRAMVITVGTGTREGTDITKPLLFSVKNSRPDSLVLLASKESKEAAEKIASESGVEECEIRVLEDIDNITNVYTEARKVFRALAVRGFEPESIAADFTSGTKAMSAGLTMAAVSAGCGMLKYVSGRRRHGIVMDGTETEITTRPNIPLMHREIEIAYRTAKELDFRAALSILSGVNLGILDDATASLGDNLLVLVSAYHRWDLFDHMGFCAEYSKARFDCPELRCFRIEKKVLPRLAGIRRAIEGEKVTPDLMADVFDNATRRGVEGKYDDAVARLYRLAELLAQRELSERYGISTSDVDLDRVPEPLRNSLRPDRDGKVKVGMAKAYEILASLGNDLGKRFLENKKLRGLLQERNASILAHGTKPVTKECFLSLLAETKDLLESVDEKFEERASELQFPWLVSKMKSLLNEGGC